MKASKRYIPILLIIMSLLCGTLYRLTGLLSMCLFLLLPFSAYLIFAFRKEIRAFEVTPRKNSSASSLETITFQNVAANENALKALSDIVDYLKNPVKYKRLGARIPHGVLLYGPPGTGKTLLARALAGESGVPFIAMNGSDFVEMYVGVGAARVRETFKKARKHGKCVIFIDEIDTLGRTRGINSSEERDQTLNALLSEMSGFHPSDGIVVVAATNRAEMLDPALLRPGRFDRRIEVGMPTCDERKRILNLYLCKKPIEPDVSVDCLAEKTVFFSGAMIENLINEACILAARKNAERISKRDLDEAYITLTAGSDLSSHFREDERRIVSIHEAGHAVVSLSLLPENRLERISVIPSSNGSAGYNLSIPQEKRMYTRADFKSQLCVLLAGRCAEEICAGKEGISGGASNDLKRASEIAVSMVFDMGLGDDPSLSVRTLSKLTGRSANAYEEVQNLLNEAYDRAKNILMDQSQALNRLARILSEKEVLEEEEIKEIMK